MTVLEIVLFALACIGVLFALAFVLPPTFYMPEELRPPLRSCSTSSERHRNDKPQRFR